MGWQEPKEVYGGYLQNQSTVESSESYLAKSLYNRLKEHYDKPVGLIEHEKRKREYYRNPVHRLEPDLSAPESIGNSSVFQKMVKGVICFVMFGFVCVILNEPEANRKKELEKRLKIKLHRVETRLGEEKVALL